MDLKFSSGRFIISDVTSDLINLSSKGRSNSYEENRI